MSSQKQSDALRDALQFLVSSSMPAQHKSLLMDLVGQAMRAEELARRDLVAQATIPEWQPEEIQQLRDLLAGRVARSWQHADELLMRLATQLKRRPADVRAKATELDLGAGVDYRLAQAQNRLNAMP
jgi:hypothetical protein